MNIDIRLNPGLQNRIITEAYKQQGVHYAERMKYVTEKDLQQSVCLKPQTNG